MEYVSKYYIYWFCFARLVFCFYVFVLLFYALLLNRAASTSDYIRSRGWLKIYEVVIM